MTVTAKGGAEVESLTTRATHETDLYVPLNHFEASVYAQIDGQTSCRDLVAAASHAPRVADVMLKLWRSDQIIFDRSTI